MAVVKKIDTGKLSKMRVTPRQLRQHDLKWIEITYHTKTIAKNAKPVSAASYSMRSFINVTIEKRSILKPLPVFASSQSSVARSLI